MSIQMTGPGCSLCGCYGIHACPGHPVAPWSEEEKQKLRAALQEIADREAAEANQEKGHAE